MKSNKKPLIKDTPSLTLIVGLSASSRAIGSISSKPEQQMHLLYTQVTSVNLTI